MFLLFWQKIQKLSRSRQLMVHLGPKSKWIIYNHISNQKNVCCIDISDITASYGKSIDFIAFFHTLSTTIHVWIVVYPQIFTACVSYWCTYFGMSTCQMWQQVMEGSLIRLRYLGIFIYYWKFLNGFFNIFSRPISTLLGPK